tara:strand:+ start:633 stop:1127 length:495 start_codon:yes stop_codon:yes gene_type:complete
MKTIDNFLSQDLFNQLKDTVYSDSVPWFSKSGTVDNKKDIAWFSHCIYNEFKPDSNLFALFPEFIERLNISSIIQIRCNLSFKTNKDFKTVWHTDYTYKNHKTAIFYFNTDTSGTYFKIKGKEKFVRAKANRMVVFDGNIQHCAYLNNKTDKRVVINFNYYEKS